MTREGEREKMKSRTMRRVAVLVTGAALAVSVPVASSVADQGGVPHNNKPCPSKSKGHGPKKPAPNSNGKKCGFNR
jgi:hypothetical protein